MDDQQKPGGQKNPTPRGRGRGNFNNRRLERPVLSWQLPPDQWPDCDRKALEAAYFVGGPLSTKGPAANWAPDTREVREAAFGRLLSFLKHVNALDPVQPTETRLTNELLTAYIGTMRLTLRAHTIQASLHSLYLVLRAMVPGYDFRWIRGHPDYPREREVRASKKPVRSPNPFLVLARAFLEAEEAGAEVRSFKSALRYRDAVIMMVLVTTAIRLKNLSELRVGEHLLFYPTYIRLIFEHSVKNREIIDSVLSERVAAHMLTYFEVHRDFLLRDGPDHGAVWINIDGNQLQYSTMGQLITKIANNWGFQMSPHGARYALATTVMAQDPRRIAVASAALAHRGTSSVNRVYDQSGGAAAQAYWQRLLDGKLRRR